MYKPIYPGTYYFDNFTFTSLGNSGHRGPTSDQTYADAPWPSSSYFSIKNGQQNWTVPANGTYQITAAGAYGATPGRVVTGQVALRQDQVLTMLVGQEPTPLTANVADNVTVGGGGGTFIVANGTPLMVASGGDGSGPTSSSGSFLPSGSGTGGSGAGYYGNGSGTNPYFQFLVPYAYVNGGYGNSYEYGQPALLEEGGFGGGQSPIGRVTDIDKITGNGTTATCNTHVPHGYPYNYVVKISGTTYYDGTRNITVKASNVFTFSTSNTQTVTTGTVSGIATGSSGGGGYTGSPGNGTSGATCYADSSVQNFTDLGANSNASGYVTVSLVNPIPLVQSPTWNKIWTTQYDPFVPAQSNAVAVTNGNGIYVAVTNNGQSPVLYSADGISWYTTNTTGTVVAPWCAVVYGNSLFVALASDGTSMTSSDGVNWSSVTYGYPFWSGIAYGNGLFVAVTNRYMPASWYSTDGTTWSYGNLSTDKWSTISYGNGVFIALTNWGTVPYAYSYDGITWSSSAAGFNNLVSTIAGLALAYGSSDGTGAKARFNSPQGITYDGNGNLYICDYNNNTIRKLVISTGVVTTIAGLAGFSGSSDGTGSSARFYSPASITYDGNGNLYICDLYNYTIRKLVISTAAVTTIAGLAGFSGSSDGTGANARFYYPTIITYDGNGNLYISDTYNYTIRKLMISTAAVTTTAGLAGSSGSSDGMGANARFWFPAGITYGGNGNLYICDASNFTIRNVNVISQYMTSVNGINWTAVSALSLPVTPFITYGNGRFVAVGNGGAVFSENGTTWTRSSNTPQYSSWTSVVYGNGYFIAVASSGSVMYSQDGNTWYTDTSGAGALPWGSIAFGNNTFLAIEQIGAASIQTQVTPTF